MKLPYTPAAISLMQHYYSQLSKKSRCHYMVVEAQKLGHGVISYISRILGSSRKTIRCDLDELSSFVAGGTDLAVVKQRQTNIDLTGYKRVMDSHAINHVIKNHGNAKREILRGQIAVNEGDFEKIPEIIAEPNTIEYAGKNDIGRDLIKFTQSKDEKLIYVEEVRSGKKEVALQTLYKQKVR